MKKFYASAVSIILATAMMTGCAGSKASENASVSEAPIETNASVQTEETIKEDSDEVDEENYNTGDATLDNIRNGDDIGDKELLVISFGTSYNDSRRLTIGAIESDIEAAFPEWSVRRGFTSNIIIDHIQRRDGILIDDIKAALQRAVDNNVKTLVIQPTHLMNGIEYDEIVETVAEYSDAFEKIVFGEPLLTSDEDFTRVENAIVDMTKPYDDGETAIVFMGHGTEHDANGVYRKMQDKLTADGHTSIFIGTVEAEPTLDDVLAAVKNGSFKRVVLQPLMVVCGDHGNNDMAGEEEDSWKSAFEAAGFKVECVLQGLGENEAIRQIYVDHARAAIEKASE